MQKSLSPNQSKELTEVLQRLEKLRKKLNLKKISPTTLLLAFVHRSYLNENPGFTLGSNERLEFLGDACLELIVSTHLYQKYPHHLEGDLTSFRSALVNSASLAKTAAQLKLGDCLLLSRGEEEGNGRVSEYILANTFEALLGVIYLEESPAKAQQVVKKYILPKLEPIIEQKLYKDAKSQLQELAQEKSQVTPVYTVLAEWGPDHNKHFRVAAFLHQKQVGAGEGGSKQKAELAAAQNALDNWPQS